MHQLRDENDKLENRYKELSARRDRLLAANSRLSKPFTSPETLETQTPLSSMLAKLKSEPDSPEKTKIQSKGGPAENNEGKEKTDCPNASTGETPSSGKETKKNEMKSPSPPISGSLPPQCVSIENEVHLKTPDKVPSTSRTSPAKVEKIERKESPSKSKASPSEKDTKTKSPRKYNKHKQEKIDTERAKQYMHQQQLIMSQHSQLQQHIQNSLMQPMLSHSQDPTVMLPSAQFLGGASTFIHQMLQQQQHNHVTQMTPQQNTAAMLNLLASQPQHFASASSENSGAANFYGYGANHVTVPDAKVR